MTRAGIERFETEVVEYEQIGAAEGFDEARMTSIASGERQVELCWILGDGVDQAADISWFATSIPSRNFTPRTIFGN